MKVLVMGGTRFSGVHLVNRLLSQGHNVTIATRGVTSDSFGSKVNRKLIDRKSLQSLEAAFSGEFYDAVVDNIAFCSNDIKNLLGCIRTNRYVLTSSVSVYDDNCHKNLCEDEVNTANYTLQWGNYEDFGYAEGKRQAEAALFLNYSGLSSVAVRFPWIFGIDDYSKRLYFYVERILKKMPIYIDNLKEELGFISSQDAGNFLAWCAQSDIKGAVNAGSVGTVTLEKIIDYVQKKSGITALLTKEGESAPLNTAEGFSLNLDKATAKGYNFQNISDWLYSTLDHWITELS